MCLLSTRAARLSVHDPAQLPERQLRRGVTTVREFGGNLPERLIIDEPARLQLPVPAADELVRRLGEVPEHVCDEARGLGVAEGTGTCEVFHKVAMLLYWGDLHDPIMTAGPPFRKNPARYRAGSGSISMRRATVR